jgi:uncharacterized RDD family membrane protein YckC
MTLPYAASPRSFSAAPAQDYIDAILACVPDSGQRQRIELEQQSRLDPRMTVEQATATYGHPRNVAEFYLASVSLQSAPFFRRLIAALIDIPSVIASGILFFYFAWKLVGFGSESFITGVLVGNPLAIALCFLTLFLMSPMYYIIAETWTSQTVGKALMGIRTVRESGARISVAQAMVRQIPLFFGFYFLDGLFALFTEKKQRLFELISKTRVVRAD